MNPVKRAQMTRRLHRVVLTGKLAAIEAPFFGRMFAVTFIPVRSATQ